LNRGGLQARRTSAGVSSPIRMCSIRAIVRNMGQELYLAPHGGVGIW